MSTRRFPPGHCVSIERTGARNSTADGNRKRAPHCPEHRLYFRKRNSPDHYLQKRDPKIQRPVNEPLPKSLSQFQRNPTRQKQDTRFPAARRKLTREGNSTAADPTHIARNKPSLLIPAHGKSHLICTKCKEPKDPRPVVGSLQTFANAKPSKQCGQRLDIKSQHNPRKLSQETAEPTAEVPSGEVLGERHACRVAEQRHSRQRGPPRPQTRRSHPAKSRSNSTRTIKTTRGEKTPLPTTGPVAS
jgi:hypothetical protein